MVSTVVSSVDTVEDADLTTGMFRMLCVGLPVLLAVLLEPGQLMGETPPARQV